MTQRLLSRLRAANRQLARLVIATAPDPEDHELLERLLDKRDEVVWQINRIMLSELTASVAQIDAACEQLDAATARLKLLTARIESIDEAIDVANGVIGIAAGIATKVV
jgi:hypothetical protein